MGCLEKFFRSGPTEQFLKQIDTDLFGLIHFSVNTFTDREWGYGYPEDGLKFNPSDFDAEQIVSAAKSGGLKGLILVCKHHDGYCLWPTKTTDYNVTMSPWRDHKGDVVREISDACRKFGLKFGVYVSPWDRNCAVYGTPQYKDIYRTQLREVLTQYGEIFEMWFDGANGGDGWYGGAQEKRDIGDPVVYYGWEEVFQMVRTLQPNARIFCQGPDVRWCGNERGHIPSDCRCNFIPFDYDKTIPAMTPAEIYELYQRGSRNGKYFIPPECDFPMRQGWFYHPASDGFSMSSLNLLIAYLNTVGNGGLMNLGITPDKRGRITDEDCCKLKGFRERLLKLRENKVFEFQVSGEGKHSFALPDRAEFDVIELVEDIAKVGGEVVQKYSVSLDNSILAEGTVIGMRRIRVLSAPASGSSLEFCIEGNSSVTLTGWKSGADMMTPEEDKFTPAHNADFEDVTDKIIETGDSSLTVDFGSIRKINGFVIAPDPDNLEGIPLRYTIRASVDGENWNCILLDEGFENIYANPVPQKISFRTTECRYFRFESFETVREGAKIKILSFGVKNV